MLLLSVRQIRGNARPITSKTPPSAASARNSARQPDKIAVSFAAISVDVRQGSIRRKPTVRSSTSPANAIAVAATRKKTQKIDDVNNEMNHGEACSRMITYRQTHPKSNASHNCLWARCSFQMSLVNAVLISDFLNLLWRAGMFSFNRNTVQCS